MAVPRITPRQHHANGHTVLQRKLEDHLVPSHYSLRRNLQPENRRNCTDESQCTLPRYQAKRFLNQTTQEMESGTIEGEFGSSIFQNNLKRYCEHMHFDRKHCEVFERIVEDTNYMLPCACISKIAPTNMEFKIYTQSRWQSEESSHEQEFTHRSLSLGSEYGVYSPRGSPSRMSDPELKTSRSGWKRRKASFRAASSFGRYTPSEVPFSSSTARSIPACIKWPLLECKGYMYGLITGLNP